MPKYAPKVLSHCIPKYRLIFYLVGGKGGGELDRFMKNAKLKLHFFMSSLVTTFWARQLVILSITLHTLHLHMVFFFKTHHSLSLISSCGLIKDCIWNYNFIIYFCLH